MATDNQSLMDTSRELMQQFLASDFSDRAYVPEVIKREDALTVPFFGQPYHLSVNGVNDQTGNEANPAISILILSYVLQWPEPHPSEGTWVTYREMGKVGPLAGYFTENKNKILETSFSGQLKILRDAALNNGGTVVDGHPGYDLTMCFNVLPGIPILLKFNDADDDFPAQSSLLFRESAKTYLGLKPLGIAGTLLVGNLLSNRCSME